MRAELGLPSVKGDDEHGGGMTGGFGGSMGGTGQGKAKRPINVKFEIPYFTTSGIQVRYLKITEPKVCFSFLSSHSSRKKQKKKKKLTHLFPVYSFNTPPFHGFDTSRNPVTLLFACQMHKRMT